MLLLERQNAAITNYATRGCALKCSKNVQNMTKYDRDLFEYMNAWKKADFLHKYLSELLKVNPLWLLISKTRIGIKQS